MAAQSRGPASPDHYDDPGFGYARWWAGRGYEHHAEVMALRRLLHGQWFARAADVGGGVGRLSLILAEFAGEVTLADASRRQLEISRRFLAHHPHVTGRVLEPGGCAVIEVANSAHAVNRVRALARREPIPVTARDVGGRGGIPFVHHHPATVARQFRAAGLQVRRTLSVSNFRHPLARQVMPARALLAAERLAQEALAGACFGPSLMFLAEKPAARLTSEGIQ